jgi:hypothetical protein
MIGYNSKFAALIGLRFDSLLCQFGWVNLAFSKKKIAALIIDNWISENVFPKSL